MYDEGYIDFYINSSFERWNDIDIQRKMKLENKDFVSKKRNNGHYTELLIVLKKTVRRFEISIQISKYIST